MHCHFLGWNEAFLDSFHRHLLDNYQAGNILDLSHVHFVFPTARAGRECIERLKESEKEDGLKISPPKVITIGSLAEETLEFKHPVAEHELSILLWIEVLKSLDITSVFPQATATPKFIHSAAKTISNLHLVLSSCELSFKDVALHFSKNGLAGEKRWQELEKIKGKYLSRLAALELTDRYQEAIDSLRENRVKQGQTIFLCSCYDINPYTEKLIQRLSTDNKVEAFIFAPEEQSAGFSELGAVQAEYWSTQDIPMLDKQLTFCDSASVLAQQCQQACQHRLDSGSSNKTLKLGLLDTDLLDSLTTVFHSGPLTINYSAGKALSSSLCFDLIFRIKQVLKDPSFKHYASLLRHPNVLPTFGYQPEEILTKLDEYYSQHLPLKWDCDSVVPEITNFLNSISDYKFDIAIENLLQSFFGEPPKEYSLVQSAAAFKTLAQVVLRACPQAPLNEQLDYLLFLANENQIDQADASGDIDVVGWLELALDTTPGVVLLGMNDETIPAMFESTAFLNNTLKKDLGIPTSDDRLGRDSFLLTTILKSKSFLHVFVPRVSGSGDPLSISRLLLRDTNEVVSRRVLGFYGESTKNKITPRQATDALFTLPAPEVSQEINSIRVSSFSDYLQCPYLFYLKHVLNVSREHDDDNELSARVFGTLAHSILEHLPLDSVLDEREVLKVISDGYEHEITKRFKGNTLPAAWIQLELLKQRFDFFAEWQAKQFELGWIIAHKELKFTGEDLKLKLPQEQSMEIRGIIDRIDYHKSDNRWRIIDYKTSEERQSVSRAYSKSKQTWYDLQLPLYAEFAIAKIAGINEAFKAGKLEIAYVNISKNFSQTPFDGAVLNEEMHSQGMNLAVQVASHIRQATFLPPRIENWKYDLQDLLPEEELSGRR